MYRRVYIHMYMLRDEDRRSSEQRPRRERQSTERRVRREERGESAQSA
jgi:hypothetical protein